MPIKVQRDLPAKEILENENIFVMDEYRAMHQDIRPLNICILNLMPVKQDTELQLARVLSNTPLQIDVAFMKMNSHLSLNTPIQHLNRFYNTFDELKHRKFDGLIITGAPVEQIPFEEVDYWQELCEIHPSYLLGGPGRALLSLWDREAFAPRKAFWGLRAQGDEPENPSGERL